jgi:hypothetical protein
MALFSKKGPDASLHEFTKFLQAEGRDELAELAQREHDALAMTGIVGLPVTEDAVDFLMNFHSLVYNYLRAVIDDAEVAYGDMLEITEIVAKHMKQVISPENLLPGDFLSARAISWDLPRFQRLETALVKLTIYSMWQYMHGAIQIDSCQECDGLFVVSRHGQRWCSHRCRVRRSERERYASRKAPMIPRNILPATTTKPKSILDLIREN